MKKWLVLSVLVIVIAAFTTVTKENKINNQEDIKKAVNKTLPLLQNSSHLFLENAGGCQSCHHQDLTAVSLSLAKEKGFQINEAGLTEIFDSIQQVIRSRKEVLAKNLMLRQTGEGSWVSPNPRPPLEFYSFSATALMGAAIQYYSPAALK